MAKGKKRKTKELDILKRYCYGVMDIQCEYEPEDHLSAIISVDGKTIFSEYICGDMSDFESSPDQYNKNVDESINGLNELIDVLLKVRQFMVNAKN